jgi:hypothetical protein
LRYWLREGNLAEARSLLEERVLPLEDAEVTARARKIIASAGETAKGGPQAEKP